MNTQEIANAIASCYNLCAVFNSDDDYACGHKGPYMHAEAAAETAAMILLGDKELVEWITNVICCNGEQDLNGARFLELVEEAKAERANGWED